MGLNCVFDFDGTLVDSSVDIARAVNRMRRQRNLDELPVETIRRSIGHGARALFEKCLSEPDQSMEKLLEEFRDVYFPICTDNIEPFPGMGNLLRELEDDRTAIVTNKPVDMTMKILQTLGWEDWFQPVYGMDSLEEIKPDPLPLRETARGWGVSETKLIMIGDSWSDVEAGTRAGAYTIGCNFGMGPDGSPAEFDPDSLVEDVQQLRDVLAGLR